MTALNVLLAVQTLLLLAMGANVAYRVITTLGSRAHKQDKYQESFLRALSH